MSDAAPAVLVVDDDVSFGRMLERLLSSEGYDAASVASAAEALETLDRRRFDIVLSDLKMPDASGIDLLRKVRERHAGVEVVIMTGYGTIPGTVEAMKLGAADFIPKPFDNIDLLAHLAQVAKVQALEREVGRLRAELRERDGPAALIGDSPVMARVRERIAAAARTTSNVLISGETGTGKELAARAIHHAGDRAGGRFIGIGAAALPPAVIESELFGHVRGAFPGAVDDRPGLFRAAAGGTLFLDEIAAMPAPTQAKLLRALEESRIRPIGSTEEVPVDCRIIAATNRDPLAAIARGELREDLYFRLAVLTIEMPPLRDRREDIPALARHFIARMNERFGRQVRGLSSRALAALLAHSWPGNIRELRNAIEGTFALARGDTIELEDLPPGLADALARAPAALAAGLPPGGSGRDVPPLEPTLVAVERNLIERALALASGNKSRAADMLKVSRKRIYRKIEEYGIEIAFERANPLS